MKPLRVPPSSRGETLLSFLRGALPDYSSVKAIKRAIDNKQCKVNGRVEMFSTYRVKPGDEITISLEKKQERIPLEVLMEDETILVCNKPAHMASEEFEGLILVHRLDKETSGVMIFAKHDSAAKNIIQQFRDRTVEKSYYVLADGLITLEKWKIDCHLALKAEYQGGKIYGKAKEGKKSTTIFEKLKTGNNATLLLAKPITGRTHQIRVHLKEMGHPVLGDWQYAKKFTCSYEPKRHMLHAYKIAFKHPINGEELEFKAPLPKDFLVACKAIGIDA